MFFKKENENAINKVIKMVISLNSAISLLFRLPIAFTPIVNVVAEYGEFYSTAPICYLLYHPTFHLNLFR